jgi:hypothetical protein
MAARTMKRSCSKRNETTRLTTRSGHLWPLLGLCPGNMPYGRDASRSLKWRLARALKVLARFRCDVGTTETLDNYEL